VGKVEAIWLKTAHGGPMAETPSATLVPGAGIQGNADQGGRRQVTLIEREAWEAVQRELGVAVPPVARRANVLLSGGIGLALTAGRVLRLGGCRVRILGETRPCGQMDAAQAGLRAALQPEWRGGAYGEVLDGATLHVGDAVEWEAEAPTDA
jgi:MOSC domain-containing protein YiiM